MVSPAQVESGSATPRFIAELGTTVTELMGETSHTLTLPFEQRKANYQRATDPVIEIQVDSVRQKVEDPQNIDELVVNIEFSITVKQRLIGQRRAGYSKPTFYRLWQIIDYLASRIHRIEPLVPEQSGRLIEVFDIDVTSESQQEQGSMTGIIKGRVPMVLVPQASLQTTEQFRRSYVPTPAGDGPIIEDTEVVLEVE